MARPADGDEASDTGMTVWASVNGDGVECELTLHGQPFHPEVLDSLTRRVGDILGRQIREARKHESAEAAAEEEDDEAQEGKFADIVCHYEDTKERPNP